MKRQTTAIGLGLAVAAAGILGIAADLFAGFDESLGLRALYAARGPQSPPPEVVVIALDEPSARELGLPDQPRGWPRRLHAEVVRYLARSGASVVGFDLSFETPSPDPADDQALAAAIEQAGNVVLTARMRAEAVDGVDTAARLETVIPPVAALARAAQGTATFLLPKAQRVNHYWTFREGGSAAAALPVLAFHLFAWPAFEPLRALAVPRGIGPAAGRDDTVAAVREAIQGGHPRADAIAAAGAASDPALRPWSDTLLALHAGEPVRLLNYYGPARTVTTLPFAQALRAARSDDEQTARKLAGKAVFIGYSAATPAGQDRLRDDYRTVYSRADGLDLSGVEIAATAFANLLDRRWLRTPALVLQIGAVAAWGLLLGAIGVLLRPRWAAAALLAAAAAWCGAALMGFGESAWWWPTVVPVAAQVPLALFGGVAVQYRELLREREAVRRAIGYYLPASIIEGLSRSTGPVTGADRVLYGTCLSTDVEGYTRVSESLTPAKLGALMNAYFATLFTTVEQGGGTIVDVVGDAMIAIWTDPRTERDLRMQACAAACAAAEAVGTFNAAAGLDRPSLPTRFGLHAGDMLVGSIGGGGHYEYRAVGDIINTASRIQDLNKQLGTRLLASAASVEGLDLLATRPLGPFVLAGKANPIEIVEILGSNHDISAERSRFYEDFATALAAYRSCQWTAAAAAFAALAAMRPDDGPTRYYRDRCDHLARQAGTSPEVLHHLN